MSKVLVMVIILLASALIVMKARSQTCTTNCVGGMCQTTCGSSYSTPPAMCTTTCAGGVCTTYCN